MRWRGRRESANVEDRRGRRGPIGARGAGIGCGGLLLVVIFAMLTGQDPLRLVESLGGGSAPAPQTSPGGGFPGQNAPGAGAGGDELGSFAKVVLANTEDVWNQVYPQIGRRYQPPTMVLFTGQVRSACGFASAAVGPFYCPADRKVYLDLAFFGDLERRFGAPGDFGQAYVIAHEVGHHIQNLLGISGEVHRLQQRTSKGQANQLSVRLELQADCLAGVWGHHAHTQHQLLEPGDFEEGLRAAAAIGDDMMQRRAGGYVQPESWTHGSSDQRVRWLRRGLESGDPNVCETFDNGQL